MSYCVNCGVELHPTAKACPLCHTPIYYPQQRASSEAPTPFPVRREEVPPVSRKELVLLLTVLLFSVSLCCGLLNLFLLRSDRPWSLYIIGAAVLLWVWFVPPLVHRALPLWVRLWLDACAVGVYIYLISIDLHGQDWFLGLALPIISAGSVLAVLLGLLLANRRRSILTSVTLIIGAVGLFVLAIECFIDRWLERVYAPSWSIVVLAICVALIVPLVYVRRTPGLREEARRRFHM